MSMGAPLPCRLPIALDRRMALALRPRLDGNTALLLAHDPDLTVLQGLARNPWISPAAQLHLARHENSVVRRVLADRDPTIAPLTDEAVRLLATDVTPIIRRRVAENAHTSAEILKNIALNDSDDDVRAAAVRNRALSIQDVVHVSADSSAVVRITLVSRADCPPNVLEALSIDDTQTVRLEVAGHLRCPVAVLLKLAQDSETEVRQEVAYNPGTPTSALQLLSEDKALSVRMGALSSLDTRESISNH